MEEPVEAVADELDGERPRLRRVDGVRVVVLALDRLRVGRVEAAGGRRHLRDSAGHDIERVGPALLAVVGRGPCGPRSCLACDDGHLRNVVAFEVVVGPLLSGGRADDQVRVEVGLSLEPDGHLLPLLRLEAVGVVELAELAGGVAGFQGAGVGLRGGRRGQPEQQNDAENSHGRRTSERGGMRRNAKIRRRRLFRARLRDCGDPPYLPPARFSPSPLAPC